MQNKSLALVLIIILSYASGCKRNSIEIKDLRCESLYNPRGITNITPRLSWILESKTRSQVQTAYQILVASTIENLKNNNGDIWDSKKVESDKSILINYEGSELKPATIYYWKVKVWNRGGDDSGWSKAGTWQMGLLKVNDWGNAKWIGYRELPDSMRFVPGLPQNDKSLGNKAIERAVIPLFRKEFELSKKIREASLFICGLGQYEASINGIKIGAGFLTPGWTNYDKSVFYNCYDVANLLQQGKNTIGVIVGNGFYYINRERYRKLVVAYGEPTLIVQMRVTYTDGTIEIFVTDENWKCSPSPITYSSIYGGEDYDARLEQDNWNKYGFDDSDWQNALIVKGPSGQLVAENDYPVNIMEKIDVKKITSLSSGGFLYDFGQNASGIVELKVIGKKGQQIKLIPAELITKDNLANQTASGDPSYFTYTLKGDGVESWMPRFTYYGFRYVQVEGAIPDSCKSGSNVPRLVDLKLLHTRNSSPATGSFNCSFDLFNRTNELIRWAIKSNFQSVITDCPHREKLGWLEQTYLMGGSIHYNFDLFHLYSKQVHDMMESQTGDGLVPDYAPVYMRSTGGFRDSPEWGSASVILPWLIYKWYGDISVMEKAWPMMIRYVEYLKSKSIQNILSYGLGDWFDLGPQSPGPSQLTPIALTATAIYYYDLVLLSQMAGILKKDEEKKSFSSWASEVKIAFNEKFYNSQTGVYSTGSQTAMAMPWCVGLVDDANQIKVMGNLADSIYANGKKLTAGDIGFHYLVKALTKGDKSQLLYEMNARDDVPGYGFQLKKGATALTESWAALEIVSNNHLMLGHLMEWFYSGLGGIDQEESSMGYKKIIIKPEMVGDITFSKTN
ncbi:MAG: family 78 glycoside hydrolase catalytic domain, partial [Bacteroidia bacterium]|nr:family 78 glycoside hydrolase catalytic domain [Bacteroidia bacterium]